MSTIRYATREDSSLIFDFIKKMAIYEKLLDELVGNVELLENNIFDKKGAEVIFIMEGEKEVGFSLYFYNFSTFLTKQTLYLEDIFVLEDYRGKGYGKKMFDFLIKKAKDEDLGRIEWVCLNWNNPSIKFYESLGAKPMDEWTTFRLTEENLKKL